MLGKIHSIQSLGTLDGPGIRFVIFLQGCNLRCGCCHNPDTWNIKEGKEADSLELVNKALRYKEYFKDNGGITLSGGEPLLHKQIVKLLYAIKELRQGENSFFQSIRKMIAKKLSGDRFKQEYRLTLVQSGYPLYYISSNQNNNCQYL